MWWVMFMKHGRARSWCLSLVHVRCGAGAGAIGFRSARDPLLTAAPAAHRIESPVEALPFEVIMLAYIFILFAVVFRFIPHPMAFTPVGAALLFFGARGPR